MLPSAWIDALFAKLSIRYGEAFMRQWPGADPVLVKADWSEVLDGTSGPAIAYALRYLGDAPPNAIKFRDQCRRMPVEVAPALPAPPADPQRVADALAKMQRAQQGSPMAWAFALRDREARQPKGEGATRTNSILTRFQRHAWREALGLEPTATIAEAMEGVEA